MPDLQRALRVATAAVYNHHPSLKVQGIAAAWADAGATARGVLRALAADGWSIVPSRQVEDLERERDELLAELRTVERQRDRLLEEKVDATTASASAGGAAGPLPWPLDEGHRPGSLGWRLERSRTPTDEQHDPRI
jgi:hypothetical protein